MLIKFSEKWTHFRKMHCIQLRQKILQLVKQWSRFHISEVLRQLGVLSTQKEEWTVFSVSFLKLHYWSHLYKPPDHCDNTTEWTGLVSVELCSSERLCYHIMRISTWGVTTMKLTCCLVAKSYPTLCDPMDCSMPGSSVLHWSNFLKLCDMKTSTYNRVL